MYDIYLSGRGGRQGTDFENFSREFLSICESHRRESRALAFAFILYDYRHPDVRQVLDNRYYWDALNQVSGSYLTVFSFNLGSAQHYRNSQPYRSNKRYRPASLNDASRFIGGHFKIDIPQAVPLLLFFQVADERISHQLLFEIKAESVEASFAEIRDALEDAVESVEAVTPENRGNTAEIFQLIETRLSQRVLLRRMGRFLNLVGLVRDFVANLTGA
jgi:hypothetical protein